MNAKQLLDSVVKDIRGIPAMLSGDDSPLTDTWEEIKEQVRNELSFEWPAYLETIKANIGGTVAGLSAEALAELAADLKKPPEERGRIEKALLTRLIARARRERMGYRPFDFKYFRYTIAGMPIFGIVKERTGMSTSRVVAFSGAAPDGEEGDMDTNSIERTLTREEFEKAKLANWEG